MTASQPGRPRLRPLTARVPPPPMRGSIGDRGGRGSAERVQRRARDPRQCGDRGLPVARGVPGDPGGAGRQLRHVEEREPAGVRDVARRDGGAAEAGADELERVRRRRGTVPRRGRAREPWRRRGSRRRRRAGGARARRRASAGTAAGAASTIGSQRSSAAANGPAAIGSSTTAASSAPDRSRASSSAPLPRSSRPRPTTPPSRVSAASSGSTRPSKSRATPSAGSGTSSSSSRAAASVARIACAWSSTTVPAVVSVEPRTPAGRTSSGVPTTRSSCVICTLTAEAT